MESWLFSASVGVLIVVELESWRWVERGLILLVEITGGFLAGAAVVKFTRWSLSCLARGFLITEEAPLLSFVTLGVIPEL